ncbi:thyrotropin-releasing hormone receptor-like [Amphiura filiformis]|uniref:thyrotropin-releasing hormone receptor-like n=1 Tax=Amphiura filiformis TaxID=82378 RepID=UPI003B20C50A
MESCNINNTFEWSYEEALYNSHHKWLQLGVLPLLMIVGVVGNLGFLFVLFKLQQMRSITNFYLGNLAVADLSFITLMAIHYIWSYVYSDLKFDVPYKSSLGCVIFTLFTYISVFSSFALITLVIVERYFATCKPLYHRIVSGRSRSIKLVIATWFTSIVFAAIYTPSQSSLKFLCIKWPESELFVSLPTKVNICSSIAYRWIPPLSLYIQAIPFWSALLVNVILSINIIMTLHRREPLTEIGNQKSTKLKTDTTRNQVAKMLIVNNATFFLFAGPFQVMNLIQIIEHHYGSYLIGDFAHTILLWVGRVAAIANSAVNPIIYNVTNSRYRAAFAKCFSCTNVEGGSGNNGGTQTLQISLIPANHKQKN